MSETGYLPGNPAVRQSNPPTVITGCSGSGKSSLLEALARGGYRVLPEAGRQIVKEQLLIGGPALPWEDMARFAELAAYRAAHFYNAIPPDGAPSFSDRSVVDVISSFARHGRATPPHLAAMLDHYRYAERVFVSPPWKALFHRDAERRHGFEEAVAEYEWLLKAYAELGYTLCEIPRLPVEERADFVAEAAGAAGALSRPPPESPEQATR